MLITPLFIVVFETFQKESEMILQQKEFINELKLNRYDFALIDSPSYVYTLVPYKLSIPYGLVGFDTPHILRRLPYLPR